MNRRALPHSGPALQARAEAPCSARMGLRTLRAMLNALSSIAARFFAAIGRTGATGLAVSLVFGTAMPFGGAVLKPALPVLVALFVTLGFARLDFSHVRSLRARPLPVLLTILWIVLSAPIAVWAALSLLGRSQLDSGLILGLSLQAAASPILATPAVALLLGLEGSFALIVLTAAMVALPVTAPVLASFVAGDAVPLDGWRIAANLATLLSLSWTAAWLIRRRWPLEAIRRAKTEIDGANIFLFFIFGWAIMEGTAARALAEPLLVATHVAVAFAVSLGGLGAALLTLRRLIGTGDAIVTGYATGHRNAGLMVAAMGGVLPDTTWLYFAAVQIPIYVVPMLILPLARRLMRREGKRRPQG